MRMSHFYVTYNSWIRCSLINLELNVNLHIYRVGIKQKTYVKYNCSYYLFGLKIVCFFFTKPPGFDQIKGNPFTTFEQKLWIRGVLKIFKIVFVVFLSKNLWSEKLCFSLRNTYKNESLFLFRMVVLGVLPFMTLAALNLRQDYWRYSYI